MVGPAPLFRYAKVLVLRAYSYAAQFVAEVVADV